MTTPNFDQRRNLVELSLNEKQQIDMLGRKADAASWVQADEADRIRLETLSMVIFAIQNTYKESASIQRWFERPNRHLQNRAPIDILAKQWKPEDRSVQVLLIVSQSLCGDPDRAASCERCNPKPQVP